ncbi:hypothetical protein LTR36_009159 [Oleoguttula mirabilis]|uniref:Uncharacterized protein n=1 Tax=Oleoguttula mirabilis TaxID=1507867 RepID=A0AAV9J6C8_9PEZI|nr:hypothetical protein LTR36_009159 [Oleoguttula mirabilis]
MTSTTNAGPERRRTVYVVLCHAEAEGIPELLSVDGINVSRATQVFSTREGARKHAEQEAETRRLILHLQPQDVFRKEFHDYSGAIIGDGYMVVLRAASSTLSVRGRVLRKELFWVEMQWLDDSDY